MVTSYNSEIIVLLIERLPVTTFLKILLYIYYYLLTNYI
nr:MAG TPA: hypothetical protein [Caudoviricetes sp.]